MNLTKIYGTHWQVYGSILIISPREGRPEGEERPEERPEGSTKTGWSPSGVFQIQNYYDSTINSVYHVENEGYF